MTERQALEQIYEIIMRRITRTGNYITDDGILCIISDALKENDVCEGCIYSTSAPKDVPEFDGRKMGCKNEARIKHLVAKAKFLIGNDDIQNIADAKKFLDEAIKMKSCYNEFGCFKCESSATGHPSCYFDTELSKEQNHAFGTV